MKESPSNWLSNPEVPELFDPAYELTEEREKDSYMKFVGKEDRFPPDLFGTFIVEYALSKSGKPWGRREVMGGTDTLKGRVGYSLALHREGFRIEFQIIGGSGTVKVLLPRRMMFYRRLFGSSPTPGEHNRYFLNHWVKVGLDEKENSITYARGFSDPKPGRPQSVAITTPNLWGSEYDSIIGHPDHKVWSYADRFIPVRATFISAPESPTDPTSKL